jgi:chemotaxis signal transduction protein
VTLARNSSRRLIVHGEAAILFAIGPQKFAIAASAVDRIHDLEGLESIPPHVHPRLAKVRYTFERESRRYYVVDANMLFRTLPSRHSRMMLLHPAKREQAGVALAVDGIDRMTSLPRIQSLPKAFHGDERSWYRGLAVVDGRVVPVVNPASVLNSAELMVLDSAVNARLALAGGRS